MNLGSKLNRVRYQADRLFLRVDKTDVVGELREAEDQAEELRIVCEAFLRSLEKKLNTHSVTEEKKHRKVPENQVAETLKEALKEASQNQVVELPEKPLFRTIVEEVIAAEQLLGKVILDHEEDIEEEVLNPLQKLLKEDFPSLAKQKKALKQAGIDLDAAKARLRNSQTNVAQTPKLETYREELEDTENKLENIRDAYACDLFNMLGKQREIARLFILYLEMQVDYLQKSVKKLNAVLPPIRKTFENNPCSPVFGIPLHEHLRFIQEEIALPVQTCVRRMIEVGLREEGLLRMAGSNTKIKRLKGLFDAGFITSETLSSNEDSRDFDIHVIAGAFKSYLRELPEPLLTHIKHDELIEAVRKQDHDEKLRSLWQVINTLPQQNHANLRYVIKFLAMVSSYSSENKMTPNNIAIVMAPNLIGSHKADDTDIQSLGRNMTLGNDYRLMVEHFIEYCDYFFKQDLDFGVQPRPPPSPRMNSSAVNGTLHQSQQTGSQISRTGSHRRTGSTDLSVTSGSSTLIYPECESPKQPHRMKKKPAPLPPQGKVEDGAHSPEQVRSKTPPSMSSSTTSLSNYPNALNTSVGPSPAPRLHHTNSLRRPTAEPPKPPGSFQPPIKPPRPSPPQQPVDSQGESKPPRPGPPVALPEKENISGNAKLPVVPIGFEKLEYGKGDAAYACSDISTSESISQNNITKGAVKRDDNAPIGFHVDILKDSSENLDVEVREHKKEGGLVAGSEFRKSLEGVLKNQPQAHPRHLLKSTSSTNETNLDETSLENKAPFHLPAFPVPVQRGSKDLHGDKQETTFRSDKPALPEKPNVVNWSVVSVDHSKPIIPEKPLVIHTKSVVTSSAATEGSSAKETVPSNKENLQGLGSESETCPSQSSLNFESCNKEDSTFDADGISKEKPNKPPKPTKLHSVVQKVSQDKECLTKVQSDSDSANDDKCQEKNSDTKRTSSSSSNPDTTDL